jgi:RNA recognition motif-containing protein
VGNLPYRASQEQVPSLFAAYGEVQSISLPTDRETGRLRSFAFIRIAAADATRAITALNGKEMGGRRSTVNETRPREERGGGAGRSGGYR